MPPSVALLLYFILLICLFIIDSKREPEVSGAIWIPFIWLLIISSRMVSEWLNIQSGTTSPDAYLDGNPVDRNIAIVLFVFALIILLKRNTKWSQIVSNNRWIFIYILYCGLSISWSDFPWVSFKRYIKEIGSLLMALVVLTEFEPIEAIKVILRRCAYVLIPLSIVLYKYYPQLGRVYGRWDGKMAFTGVTNSKNSLGVLCTISALFLFWELLNLRHNKNKIDNKTIIANVVMLIMTLWLIINTNCMTGTITLILGIFVLLIMKTSFMKKNINFVGIFILFTIISILFFHYTFGTLTSIIEIFGRDVTLTGRTELWHEILKLGSNSLIGGGYQSFWLGKRLEILWAKYSWQPTESHSGYIEIYLDLGIVGLFLIIGIIISGFKSIKDELSLNLNYASIRLAFFAIALMYNITESAFRPGLMMYFIFMLIILNVPSKLYQNAV